jgi:hypothetical protein
MTLLLCLWSEFSLFLDLRRVGVLNKRGVLCYDSWAWYHPWEDMMLVHPVQQRHCGLGTMFVRVI